MGFLSDYANYYRANTGAGEGDSVDALLAQVLGDAGIDPSSPTSGADQSDPLTWAAMSVSQRMSVLPRWARDLKVLGMGKMDEPEGFVYMSDYARQTTAPASVDTPQGFGSDAPAAAVTDETSKAQSVTRAKNLPYLWDDEAVDDAIKRFQDAGLEVTSFTDLEREWGALVDRASRMYMLSNGERKVTPWDVLDLIKREEETANGGEDPENFTHTSTSKSVQDISEGEAWSVLRSNLSRMLGRDPSDQEVRDFTVRMNNLAARNPAISKTISTYRDGRLTNSKTTEVESGFGAEDMMQDSYESAQADPEYGAFQAATTYFNSAVQALGAIGDV